jgi:hypothetical protein
VPKKQEVGGIFELCGSELSFQIFNIKIKTSKTYSFQGLSSGLMLSLSHADLIWLDGTFKTIANEQQ